MEKKLTDEKWFEEYTKNAHSLEEAYCEQLAWGGATDEAVEREIEFDRILIAYVHRLQSENGNQVRMRCDMQRKYDDLQTLCIEQKAEIERLKELNAGLALANLCDLPPNEDCLTDNEFEVARKTIDKQKAKIERLTEENEYLDGCAKQFLADYQKCVVEVAERQKDVERLTSLYDGKSGFMTSSIGDLPLTVDGLRKAVDEIARLYRVQAELQEYNEKNFNDAKDLRRKNAELQKQVEELKIYLASEKVCSKQAVKDTAKEILKEIRGYFPVDKVHCDNATEDFILDLCNDLAKEYGVEVE